MSLIVPIVQCRGTPYAIGQQQAKIFLRTSKGMAFARRKDAAVPGWFDFAGQQRAFAEYSPAVWQEIEGLADGLGVAVAKAAFYFGNGGIQPPLGGCSAAITDKVYARNYDLRPRQYGARLALVQPTGSYASIGPSEILTGRLDGMNERGLSVGLHLIHRNPRKRGLSCVVIIRLLLDQCATTEEAITTLRRLPHAMRYNYSILDAAGSAAVVEATPDQVEVRTGPWLACTNHFQSPALKKVNRRAGHSIGRLPPLEQWAAQGCDAATLFAHFNSSTSPAFHHGYARGAGTLHTLVSEPAKRRVTIGIGGDANKPGRSRLDLDFAAWCAGKPLALGFLSGHLGGQSKPFAWPQSRAVKKRAV